MTTENVILKRFVNYLTLRDESVIVYLNDLINIKDELEFFRFVLKFMYQDKKEKTGYFLFTDDLKILNAKLWDMYKNQICRLMIDWLCENNRIDEKDKIILYNRITGERQHLRMATM